MTTSSGLYSDTSLVRLIAINTNVTANMAKPAMTAKNVPKNSLS